MAAFIVERAMSQLGQNAKSGQVRGMSVSSSGLDIARPARGVRFVPKLEITTTGHGEGYDRVLSEIDPCCYPSRGINF